MLGMCERKTRSAFASVSKSGFTIRVPRFLKHHACLEHPRVEIHARTPLTLHVENRLQDPRSRGMIEVGGARGIDFVFD